MKGTVKQHQVEKELETIRENFQLKINELTAVVNRLLADSNTNKTDNQNTAVLNMMELIYPLLNELKNSGLSKKQKGCVNLLESNLKKITTSFWDKTSINNAFLSHTEFQIANFIIDGKSTKEIADLLCRSVRTIDTHRRRIRKKLGLTNCDKNLRASLLSLK